MPQDLTTDQEISLTLARHVLDGLEDNAEDAQVAGNLASTLDDHAARLMPEDRKRFADQISVFPQFMAACRAFDRASAEGDPACMARQMARMKTLSEESRRAMRFRGLTDAQEALARASNFTEFCAALPSVALDRTCGSGLSGTSPFPLIWALSARSKPVERVRLMLEAGARTDLRAALGETVLHAMARMNRKGQARRKILDLLIKAGADLNAKNIHGMTPLGAAIDEGSEEDVIHFLDAGAEIGLTELQVAADHPARLRLLLDTMSDGDDARDLTTGFRDWLADEIERARQHHDDAVDRGVGAIRLADRVTQLAASMDMVTRRL